MFAGQKISSQKAQQLIKSGATLFDTRDPVSFRNGTISVAKNLPLRQVSMLLKYPKDTVMIFVGSTNEDPDLLAVVNYAIQYGFTKVYTLGGIEHWKA